MKSSSDCRRMICWTLLGRLFGLILVFLSIPLAAFADDIGKADVDTPGCAFGVNENGKPVFRDAFGMADLEHGVPIETDSVMEAGSVSKQFTAAATILVSLDGRLSLSDDIRKYLPELPEYETPVRIRHLFNHTNGLRGWGHIVDIEGWPRGTRAYRQQDIVTIVSRQRSLNYEPGEYFSYGNSGYSLLPIIVARVSGMSFQEFTKTRLLEPLGMTNTSWRDDFTRVVPKRANAYRLSEGKYVLNMPFEHTYGYGGLLTTVDDLLKWNHNLQTGEVGGQAFIDEMHRSGKLNDGTVTGYASGLRLGTRQALQEVSHGGSTAGYRSFVAHYPEKNIAVAALCNDRTSQVGRVAREAVDPFLGISETSESSTSNEKFPTPIEQLANAYRNVARGDAIRLIAESGQLRMLNGPLLQRQSDRVFTAGGRHFQFDTSSSNTSFETDDYPPFRYIKKPDFMPNIEQLATYTGTYKSEESEVVLKLSILEGELNLGKGLDRRSRLTPVYQDAFIDSPPPEGQLRLPMTIVFKRDEVGRVVAMDVISDRVWQLAYSKITH